MKKILFATLLVALLVGCSTDNEELSGVASYQTEYQENQHYTQTFYYGGGCGYISADGGHDGSWFESVCERLNFRLYDYDAEFLSINPPQEQRNRLEELNKNIKDGELKYYLVANISFLYSEYELSDFAIQSQWTMVVGKMEGYVFQGNIYNHLVIVETIGD